MATDRVIGVFKTNGFRVFPHVIAATSGLELVPLSTGGVKRTSVSSVTNFGWLEVGPQPIVTQVSAILTSDFPLKNFVVEDWEDGLIVEKNVDWNERVSDVTFFVSPTENLEKIENFSYSKTLQFPVIHKVTNYLTVNYRVLKSAIEIWSIAHDK